MKQITAKLTSNGPLLLKSDRLANPMAQITKDYKKLTSDTALKKTDEGQMMIARHEYLAGFYDDEKGVRLPAGNVWKSLVMGARKYRKGKEVEGGVVMLDNMIEFEFKGPKNHEKLWENLDFVDARTVVLRGGSRIMCYRPLLKEWVLTLNVAYDPSLIDLDNMLMYWETAGMVCRIGTYRTLFGRYTVEFV